MKYFLYGYYGFANFGDDLMCRALIHHIKARDAAARFVVKAPYPIPETPADVAYSTADRILEKKAPALVRGLRYVSALKRSLENCDWLVIGGGALFLDKGALNKSLLMLDRIVVHAKRRGIRIALIGVSCDLLADAMSLALTKRIFKAADFICVRDAFSLDYARYFGRTDAQLGADLAFAAPGLLQSLATPTVAQKPRIAVSLIDYFATYEPDPTRRTQFIEQLRAKFELHATEAEFVYVSLQENQGLHDEALRNALGGPAIFSETIQLKSTSDLSGIIAQCTGALTMRYHLGLFTAAAGLKTALIFHELKMASPAFVAPVALWPTATILNGADPLDDLCRSSATSIPVDLEGLGVSARANFNWLAGSPPSAHR